MTFFLLGLLLVLPFSSASPVPSPQYQTYTYGNLDNAGTYAGRFTEDGSYGQHTFGHNAGLYLGNDVLGGQGYIGYAAGNTEHHSSPYYTGLKAETGLKTGLNIGASQLRTNVGAEAVHMFTGGGFETGVTLAELGGSVGSGPLKVGASIGTGLGVKGGYDSKEQSLGGSVNTPVGSYGLHVGCVNKVCFVGCFYVNVC